MGNILKYDLDRPGRVTYIPPDMTVLIGISHGEVSGMVIVNIFIAETVDEKNRFSWIRQRQV